MEQDLAVRSGSFTAVTEVEPKRSHGRHEVRMLWVLADPAVNQYAGSAGTVGKPWPHLAQIGRVERRRTFKRQGQEQTEVEISYAITSRGPDRADAASLLRDLRGHWGIENKVHWVRDVTWDEDRSQVRTGAAPQVMAACRNIALNLLRRSGTTNIAAALRTYAGRPATALHLVVSAGLP